MENEAFLVPLKDFDIAKVRLRNAGVGDASSIAKSLAQRVVRELATRQVWIITESSDVRDFAEREGCASFTSPATSLNEAVSAAYREIGQHFERLIIVHGDIRHPDGLASHSWLDGITVVTDRHGTGTNVLSLPTGLDFGFAYGEGSAQLHEAEARRLGQETHFVEQSPWGLDIDTPEDLLEA